MVPIDLIHRADPVDDLTRVAEGVGVFVSPDLTECQPVPLDQTGGLDRLREILNEKSSAQPVVATVAESPKTPSLGARLRAATRGVKAWVRRTVRAVREALAWLAAPAGVVAEYLRNRREPGDYAGRHRTESTWYGAQRSTMSRVRVQRRRMAGRPPADSEPALPEYWVSHVVRAIEAIRGHEDALHPKKGYQFIC